MRYHSGMSNSVRWFKRKDVDPGSHQVKEPPPVCCETIEDIVNYGVSSWQYHYAGYDSLSFNLLDRKFLPRIIGHIQRYGGSTVKQRNCIVKTLWKYRKQIDKYIPNGMTLLNQPQWQSSLREAKVPTPWLIDLSADTFVITFSFHSVVVDLLRSIKRTQLFYGSLNWDREKYQWTITNDWYGRELVAKLTQCFDKFQVTESVQALIDLHNSEIYNSPTLVYRGDFDVVHTNSDTRERILSYLNTLQTPLQKIFMATACDCVLDQSVFSAPDADDLSDLEKNWMQQPTLAIAENQQLQFCEFLKKVNVFPIVMKNNKYAHSPRPMWIHTLQQHLSSEYLTKHQFIERLKAGTTPQLVVLEHVYGSLGQVLYELDETVWVPWLITKYLTIDIGETTVGINNKVVSFENMQNSD